MPSGTVTKCETKAKFSIKKLSYFQSKKSFHRNLSTVDGNLIFRQHYYNLFGNVVDAGKYSWVLSIVKLKTVNRRVCLYCQLLLYGESRCKWNNPFANYETSILSLWWIWIWIVPLVPRFTVNALEVEDSGIHCCRCK